MVDDKLIRYEGGENWQQLYFSLPDLCRGFDGKPKDLISNWLRTRSTLNFLGEWEQYYNSEFKVVEFDNLMRYAGDNSFFMSVRKWNNLSGKSIYVKRGRGGGTFAHLLVTIHFANWLSAKFYLQFTRSYFKMLELRYGKDAIQQQVKRMWAKLNYPLHTEAVKLTIPKDADVEVVRRKFADEADLLNVIVFQKTALEWRNDNSKLKGNMRNYASELELHVLANLENLNQFLIKRGLNIEERYEALLSEAEHQFNLLSQYVLDEKK